MEAKKRMVLLLTMLVGINATYLNAQVCGSGNSTINQLINSTEVVVKGKVIEKHCFWYNQNDIYTKHTIEVEQSSNNNTSKIYVITEGGTVDDITFKVYGLPNLSLQSQGVFFLKKNDAIAHKRYNSYSLTDFATYNEFTKTIQNAGSIETLNNFNKMLKAKHNASFQFNINTTTSAKTKQLSITGISPLTVATGRDDVLTIDGAGFGNLAGDAKVSMRSAGSLNSSAYEDVDLANILSWTNNKIKFIVQGDELTDSNSGLASGSVRITNESGDIITSTQTVKVIYNKKVFNKVPISLRSKDLDGKIAIYVERQLIYDGALPAIENALKTWNCSTGSNFVYTGVVDDVCKKYDGLNVICYDAAITNTTLGSTRVVSRNCSSIGLADQLDADIRINPNINWCFTDDIEHSQFHFESVILHELGHAFMLGHVLNELDVMYPILYNSLIKSDLTNNDIAGGLDVMSISTTENTCSSHGAVTAYGNAEQCNLCSNISNINIENLTENSAYLSWSKIPNVVNYQLQYRFGGLEWYNHFSCTNNTILFDLPACTTIEYRLSAFCDNDNNSINETVYTFTTMGCL